VIHITALYALIHVALVAVAKIGGVYLLKQAAKGIWTAFTGSTFGRVLMTPQWSLSAVETMIQVARVVAVVGGVALCVGGIVAVYRCATRPQLPTAC